MYQILRTTAGRVLKSPRDQFLLVGTLAYLLALEAVGRQLQGLVGDLFLCAALVVGGIWLAAAHSQKPIAWVSLLTRELRRVARQIRGHTIRIGLDLRGEPVIPRRVPPGLLMVAAGCEALTLAALVWNLWQPISARLLLRGISTVGFVSAQFVLWCTLLIIICGMFVAGPALLRDLYICRQMALPRERRRHVHGGWFLLLFVAVSAVGVWLVPVSAAILILAGSLLIGTVSIWWPRCRRIDFIWQPRGRSVVFSMSWRTCVSLINSIAILLCLFLLLVAVGPAAIGLPDPEAVTTSVTGALGVLASWVSATGALVFLWPMAYLELTANRRDPAAPSPTRLRVTGVLNRSERRLIRSAFRKHGWTVRFGGSARSTTDVSVLIGEAQSSTARGDWPRPVSVDQLENAEFLWSIARRDQIQRRRVFLRALCSILKQARRRRYDKSSGFWIAPQYWFILGLTRDTADRGQDDDPATRLGLIPPLYHQVFPHAARRHFHEVCQAVEIDLIFLEDGVQWRGLRRVLRMMFEHYDVHGGSRRIEELHFSGVPRVRVIIHDFELGAEWQRGQYPEPDYEDLARARVLHVFRDRGEEDVPTETPIDWDRLPSPVPAGTMPS